MKGDRYAVSANALMPIHVAHQTEQQHPNALGRRRGPIGDPTASALLLGEKWSAADLKALERARQMEAAGAPREDIWRETLWGRTPEGAWVTESDDRNMDWSEEFKSLAESNKSNLQNKSVKSGMSVVARLPKGRGITGAPIDVPPVDLMAAARTNAAYSVPLDQMRVMFSHPANDSKNSAYDPAWMRGTAVHELQHRADAFTHGDGAFKDPLFKSDLLPYYGYHDDYASEQRGEAARYRQNLTMEQRRERPFWNDYTRPENEQIYRDNSGRARLPKDRLRKSLEETAAIRNISTKQPAFPYLDQMLKTENPADVEKQMTMHWNALLAPQFAYDDEGNRIEQNRNSKNIFERYKMAGHASNKFSNDMEGTVKNFNMLSKLYDVSPPWSSGPFASPIYNID
jgi:hypothetical protein